MKSLLRFLITALVIGIILYETYFLIKENRMFDIFHPEEYDDEIVTTDNGKKDDKQNTPICSGEKNTSTTIENEPKDEKEPVKPNSETYSSKEALLDIIDRTEAKNTTSIVKDTIQDRVGLDVVGAKYADLFNFLGTNSTSCTIQVAGSMISIMPASDFIDIQQFHYDEDGNLVLYVVEGAGSGFKTRYYFANNTLIEKKMEDAGEIEESGDNISGESIHADNTDLNDIVSRGSSLYVKYLK